MYCDNVSAVYLSTNPVQHQRTKHVEIDLHFVRDRVALGEVRVLHVPTTSQYADIFTKGLPTSVFVEFRSSLNVRSAPSSDCGGVLDCKRVTAHGPAVPGFPSCIYVHNSCLRVIHRVFHNPYYAFKMKWKLEKTRKLLLLLVILAAGLT